MEYSDLSAQQKYSINGKLSQFIDVYIRQNKVWTVEQMFNDFQTKMKEEYSTGWFARIEDETRAEVIESSLKWMLSVVGRRHVHSKMTAKYVKDNDIAKKDSPIAERVRFGVWPLHYFDINYGLKGKSGHDRMTTEELRKIKFASWTNEHVADELKTKYTSSIKDMLEKCPLKKNERLFCDFWIENFLPDKENSALVPYVKGLRPPFIFFEYKNKFYKEYSEIGVAYFDKSVTEHRFYYGFMLVNSIDNKACFIDIVPDNYFDESRNKAMLAIKKAIAMENGFEYITFSETEIKSNIKGVFKSLKAYL